MNEGVFLCIDAGTTRFKTAAITPRGALVARENVMYTSNAASSSEAVHEYRTEDLTGAFLDTLRGVLQSLKGEPVLGIGITGHGPTLIPVDRKGRTLHPAVGYLDDRVKPYIRHISKKQKITSTMYIPIALFFREELPRIYEQTRTFFQPFDFLAFLLTGRAVASSSSSGIKPWEHEPIDSAGLDARKFPPICYMGEEIGRTTETAARELGISPEIPVYAIGVDFAAALVGTNMLFPGKSCERAGSSGGINLCWDRPVHDDRLLCYAHFIRGTFNVAGITSTYGKALEWARKALQVREFEWERLKRGPTDIIFFPYLKGERTPLWDPYARGGFFGMERKNDAVDLMISVYTGIVMSIRDCIDIMESAGCEFRYPVMTTGGLTGDDWFMQLKADVTGKTFTRAQVHDAELLGIAIVLAASQIFYPSLTAAASALVHEEDTYVPRADRAATYTELFRRYRKLRTMLTRHF
jgi:xylulokinase